MKLKDQVVSLELAKELKELGFKQESLFCWSAREGINGKIDPETWHLTITPYRDEFPDTHHSEDCDEHISAYTVSELGEMLSKRNKHGFGLEYSHSEWNGIWKIWEAFCGSSNPDDDHVEKAQTEADARAKMLAFLAKQNSYT